MSIFTRLPSTQYTLAVPEPNLAAVPEQAPPQGMSVTQLITVLLAYWKTIAVLTVAIAALGAVTIKFLPHTYTATATLIVNADVRDPLAGRDFPVQIITDFVSTQIELMTSPFILRPVIKRLNLMQDKSFTSGFTGNAAGLEEFVSKNLASSIEVVRGIGGQLLYVSVSAKSAASAAEIANTLTEVYIGQDKTRRTGPAAERAKRYSEELAELREKATIAQDKVTAFRKEHEIGSMNSESSGTEVEALNTLHQRLLETQNLRRSLEARQSADQPQANENVASQSLKTLLDSQLSQLAQLKSTYGPEHPKVIELNAQIAQTRRSLAGEDRALLANTKQLESKYQQALADQEAKVVKLREAQDEGSKLILELESAKSVYKQALDGFDQIMFQAVANHANVSLVSPAVPPLFASKPNKKKLFLMVLAAALGLGVGGPLAYGWFIARRIRCRDDVERDFGIAVLAQLQVVPALMEAT